MDAVTPAPLTQLQHKRRLKTDKGFASILETLNSGTATRFPIVQTAFGSAARIFEISQKVRANQDDFIEFADEGCRLVYSISLKLKDNQEIESNLKADLQELLNTLESIETFGEKCASRGTIKSIFLQGSDVKEIKAQRRKLERCMRLFGFQSLLDLREKTSQLIEQHGTNGGVSNVTENKISFANNANFGGANGNVVNHNSNNNHGAGAGHRSTNFENTNNRLNSISFGSGANFSNTTGNAFGANNEVNVNSAGHRSINTENINHLNNSDGVSNTIMNNDDVSENKIPFENYNSNNNHGASAGHRSTNIEDTNNRVNNSISFDNGANFSNGTGNAFGANNEVNVNSAGRRSTNTENINNHLNNSDDVSDTMMNNDYVSENKIPFGNNHIQEIWMLFFLLTLLVLMCFARE